MEENKDEQNLVPEADTEKAAEVSVTETVKEAVTETVPETEEDDFAEELLEMEHEEADNEIIEGLGESINKQVALEIEPLVPEEASGADDGSGSDGGNGRQYGKRPGCGQPDTENPRARDSDYAA